MATKGGQSKDPCAPPVPVCQDQAPKCPEPCNPIPVCQDQAPKCPDPCQIQDPCPQADPCQAQGKGYPPVGVKK